MPEGDNDGRGIGTDDDTSGFIEPIEIQEEMVR